MNNIRVGCEGELCIGDIEDSTVMTGFEQGIAESAYEHLFNQLMHQPPAAPVCQEDRGIIGDRDGAGKGKAGFRGSHRVDSIGLSVICSSLTSDI